MFPYALIGSLAFFIGVAANPSHTRRYNLELVPPHPPPTGGVVVMHDPATCTECDRARMDAEANFFGATVRVVKVKTPPIVAAPPANTEPTEGPEKDQEKDVTFSSSGRRRVAPAKWWQVNGKSSAGDKSAEWFNDGTAPNAVELLIFVRGLPPGPSRDAGDDLALKTRPRKLEDVDMLSHVGQPVGGISQPPTETSRRGNHSRDKAFDGCPIRPPMAGIPHS